MKCKLTLNRETIRNLDHRAIRLARGGDTGVLSECGGCAQTQYACPTETCASRECTPNTGGTRSKAPLNCNPGSGTTQDIACY